MLTAALPGSTPAAVPPPSRALPLPALWRSLPRWDTGAAVLLSVVAASLHLWLFQQHQPLWRDEVNTVQLATYPSFADTWKYLPYDSCPLLFPLLVRAGASVLTSPVAVDGFVRWLGLGIGLGIIGAFWLCARTVGGRVPLWSVALLGFNPMFIRYGDSARPYGLGIFFALMIFVTVWRVVESARPARFLLAAAMGVLAVNALFYNAVLLLVMCAGGAVVVAREKRWRHAALLLAVGLPAALSLLPYGAMIREQHRWSFLLWYPVSISWFWQRLSEVTGSPDPLGVWAWTALVVGFAGWAAYHVFRPRPGTPAPARGDRAAAFALWTLVAGIIGYGSFLLVLRYSTQPWYYVTLLALVAVCLDVLYGRLVATAGPRAPLWQLARLACVLGFSMLTYLQAKQELIIRATNLDRIANVVAARAGAEDLIVHLHWECAITFDHDYHGSTPQETLPPLTDHRLHRYDLVLQQLMIPDAAKPVLDRMSDTLRAGHRIWLVGDPLFPPTGKLPPMLEPITFTAQGRPRMHGNYYKAWAMQASYLLEQHAVKVEIIPIDTRGPISSYEDLSLSVLQGWK